MGTPRGSPSLGGVTVGWPIQQYWVGSSPQRATGFSTSATEVLHLGVALVVLTLDIAFVWDGAIGTLSGLTALETLFLFSLVAASSGFVFHELAHKFAAQRLGCWAEFRASPIGLGISLLLAYTLGILFAAPGATVIGGMESEEAWGRTSLAGPAVNLGQGAVFFSAALVAAKVNALALAAVLGLLAYINVYFSAFNLIPIGPLDGRKVWRWSHGVWAGTFVVSLLAVLGLLWAQLIGWGPFA